jgi:ADP-heptose:LPS heptosyltransferase
VCGGEFCQPCGQLAQVDYKNRDQCLCKNCAAKGENLGMSVKSVLASKENGKRETGNRSTPGVALPKVANKPAIIKTEAERLLERADANSLLGRGKLATIADCLQRVQNVPGATAELGVYKGGSALLIAATAQSASCHLFDTFTGIPAKGEDDIHAVGDFSDTTLGTVKELLKDCPNARYHAGLFPDTAKGLEFETFKFVHIDGDQYQTTRDALEYFYPRLNDGGILLFDDYQWKNCPGVEKALTEFMADKPEALEHPTRHQALIVKGKVVDKTAVDVHTGGTGIGDAITALYAACGAAKAGHKIRFHTDKKAWLSRAFYPNVEIVQSAAPVGIDVNPGYEEQLKTAPDRKQWYCDNLARAMEVEPFAPVAPDADQHVRQKRIDFGGKKYVLLSPFSAWSSREWPRRHWQELARLFVRRGWVVVALGGNHDEARLQEYFGGISGAHWFWGMEPEWIADAMLEAEAVIGNDSGMAHYAAMLGVKTIAIHAQTLPHQLWSKTNVISVQSQNYDCLGCNWKLERGFRPECNHGCGALEDVTPMQVVKAVLNPASV